MITYNGQPIPVGEIRFSPDRAKGNMGPATLATITNGAFETPPGRGVIGGPMVVQITGFDGIPFMQRGDTIESGKPLFKTYQVAVDLPREPSDLNLDVPISLIKSRKQ